MRYVEVNIKESGQKGSTGFEVQIPDEMSQFEFMQEIRKLAKKIQSDEMPVPQEKLP